MSNLQRGNPLVWRVCPQSIFTVTQHVEKFLEPCGIAKGKSRPQKFWELFLNAGKDLSIVDPIFSKNKGLRARKRSPDALNIFPDTYDLPLHPPKRLGRYATIFTDCCCNGLVAKCRAKTPFLGPQKHPFWRYLIQKIEPASCLSR